MTAMRWLAVVVAVHALASAVRAQHHVDLGRGGNAAPLSLDEHLTVEDSNGSPSLNVDSSMMLAADALEDRLAQSEHEIEKLRAQDEATDQRIEQLESRMETVSSVQASAHAKINAIHEHVMAAKAAAQGANSAAQGTLKLAEVLSTAHKAFKRTLISVESSAAGAAASAVITHGGDAESATASASAAIHSASSLASDTRIVDPMVLATAAAAAASRAAFDAGMNRTTAIAVAADTAVATMHALGAAHVEAGAAAYLSAKAAGASDAEADKYRLGAAALYDSLSDGASSQALADALANAVSNPSLKQLAAVAEQAAKHATSLLAQHRANAPNKLVSVAAITAALSVMSGGTDTYSAHALADLAAQAAVKAALETIQNHPDADAVVQGSASAGSVVTKIGSGGRVQITEHTGHALAPDDGSPVSHHAQAWAAGFAAEAVLSSGGSQAVASDCAHAATLAIGAHDKHQSLDRDKDRLKRLRGPVAYAAGSAAAVAARPHLGQARSAAVAASTAAAVTVVLGGSPTEAAGVAASAAYQAGGGTTASIAAASKARLAFPLARFEIMRHAIAAGDRAALRHASSGVAQGARIAGITAQRYISAAQAYGVRGGVAGTAAALWTLRHGGSEASASATAASAAALALASGSAALDGTTVIASASSTAGLKHDGGSSRASVHASLPGGDSVNASATASSTGGSNSRASTSASDTSGYASTQSATSAAVAVGASPEQASRAAANAAATAKLAETGNLTLSLLAAAGAASNVLRLSGADPYAFAATWVESIARFALEHGLSYAEALAETKGTLAAHGVFNATEIARLVYNAVAHAAQEHTARSVAKKALLKGTDAMDAAQEARDAILALPNSTEQNALEGAAVVAAKVAIMHGQLQAQAITTITNGMIALGMSPMDAERLATETLAHILSLDPEASAAHAAHATAHGGATVDEIAKAAADAASRAVLRQGLTAAEGARAAAAAVLAAGGSARHAQNAAAAAASSISIQYGLSDDAVAQAVHVAVVSAGGTEAQARQKASQAASEARAYDTLNCRQRVTVLATGTVAARAAKFGGTKEQVEFITEATAHAALQMLAHATGPCSAFTSASPHSIAAGLAAAVASAASTSKLSPDAVAHLSTAITANIPCAMQPGMCEHSTSASMAVEMTLLNTTAPKALATAQVAANAVLHMGEQTRAELRNAAEVAAVASKASASVALAASTSLAPGVSRSVSLALQAAAASLVGLLHGDYNPFVSEAQLSKLTAELAVTVVVPKVEYARARADATAALLKAKQGELAAARDAESKAVHMLASAHSATERAAAQAALQLAKARTQAAQLAVTKAMQEHTAASGLALSLEQAHEAVAAASAILAQKQVELAAAQAAEREASLQLEKAQTSADRAAAQAAVARARAVTAAAQDAVEHAERAKEAAFEAAVAAHVEATVVVTAENVDAFAQANLPRACGMPPVPEHGIGIGMGFVTNAVGTVVEFRCHAHYVLVGSSARTCRDDHLWSGDVAFCAESTKSPTPIPYMTFPPTPAPSPAPTPSPRCPQLAALPHGTISATGVMPGDKAFYECQEPYELVGGNSASCHRDHASHTGASWSNRPQCVKGVKVCSHVRCRVAEHSVHHAVRLEVDHGECVHTFDALSSRCREQHGDMHHCAYDLAKAACVCKCWHKQVLDTNVYAQEDLSELSALSPLSALRDTVI